SADAPALTLRSDRERGHSENDATGRQRLNRPTARGKEPPDGPPPPHPDFAPQAPRDGDARFAQAFPHGELARPAAEAVLTLYRMPRGFDQRPPHPRRAAPRGMARI